MDVLSIIRAFLQEHLRIAPEQVIPAASLKELRIDSLTLLELMFECEERLNASIADDTPMPGTIAELIAIVDKYSVPRQ